MLSSYCKKKELARQIFVSYSSHQCSYLAQMIRLLKKMYPCQIVFFLKRDLESFKVLTVHSLPFCEKKNFVRNRVTNNFL